MKLRASKLFASGLLVGFLSLASGVGYAHTQWLSPSATSVQASTNPARPTYVTVDAAASSSVFDADHNALRLDNVVITAPDGSIIDAENKSVGKLRSVFDVKLATEGTYRIAIDGNAVFATFKVGTEQKRIRGVSEEEVKKAIPADATDIQILKNFSRVETIVVAGKPGELKPLNKGLELFPLQPVSDLVVGEKAKFVVLKDGTPLKNATVKIVPGGVRYRGELADQTITSDAKGEVAIDWKLAGKYHLSVNYPPRSDDGEGGAKPPQGQPPLGEPPMGNTKSPQGKSMPAMPPVRYGYALSVEVIPE